MYQLGKTLRNRYNKFLGLQYTPDIIEATASYYNRTKTSLQLVLASLFPPLEHEMFEPGLNWQPIPFYHNYQKSDIFFVAADNCPNFRKEIDIYSTTPEAKQQLDEDKDIFEYISLKSGRVCKNYYDMIYITNLLAVEQELGLSYPEWATEIDPAVLLRLRNRAFSMTTATKDATKISAGAILEKLISDSLGKINNIGSIGKRKLFIYAGHDITLVSFLRSLKIYDYQHPLYGANVLFELHRINSSFGFKVTI